MVQKYEFQTKHTNFLPEKSLNDRIEGDGDLLIANPEGIGEVLQAFGGVWGNPEGDCGCLAVVE